MVRLLGLTMVSYLGRAETFALVVRGPQDFDSRDAGRQEIVYWTIGR